MADDPKAKRGAKPSKRKRRWTEDPETSARIGWAMRKASEHVETEPWAAVVVAQVAVEIGLAYVVDVLTGAQEPAMRKWIEALPFGTLRSGNEVNLLNALLAPTGKTIDGDERVWKAFHRHVDRRNAFVHGGKVPTVHQARASVTACKRFHDRLLTLVEAHHRELEKVLAERRGELMREARRAALEALAREGDDE